MAEERNRSPRGVFLNGCVSKSKMETIRAECVFASESKTPLCHVCSPDQRKLVTTLSLPPCVIALTIRHAAGIHTRALHHL